MNWIIVSLGVIVSSVVLYLAIRKAKDQFIPLELRNLAMFALPAVLFFAYNSFRGVSLTVSSYQLGIIVLAALLFSWLGSVFSLKALELAPNQGYSLIISKSYVVMTSILSVWLFTSPLTLLDVVAITLIVGFSGLIMIDKKPKVEKTKTDKTWLWLTFGAFLAWGFLALTLRYLTGMGLASTVILFYLTTIVSILIGAELMVKKIKLSVTNNQIWTLLAVGLASTIFNLSLVMGYKLAPNPGYINAANAGSIALVTIFSALIFKDELNAKKMIGVLGVLVGLGLLFV